MSQSSQSAGDARLPGRGQRKAKPVGPEPYDFRRPAKLAREHVRTLQIAYETFARQFSTLLTTSLRAVSHVSLISIGQQSYDEYIMSLPGTTVLAMCTIDPLPGITILEFSLSIGMVCIDHLLGGTGGPQPQRPLTDIEAPLLRGLITRILGELRYAIEPIVAVTPQLVDIEYNPQFAQVGTPSDMVLVAAFDMKVGEEECVATVCMPFNAIFPRLQSDRGDLVLSEGERQSRELAREHVVLGIEGTAVEVSVCFQPVRMHPSDLVSLKPGDVIPLAHPTSMPLAVTASGMSFAHAMPGNKGARLACLIVPSPPGHVPGEPLLATASPIIPSLPSLQGAPA
ncbi:MAG: flagellar motor switch protein FliM, partial [Micromonosporaceae bacterium]|nr:flagellar motor switch protein FliM [Micromonosporaceae bacterium]